MDNEKVEDLVAEDFLAEPNYIEHGGTTHLVV